MGTFHSIQHRSQKHRTYDAQLDFERKAKNTDSVDVRQHKAKPCSKGTSISSRISAWYCKKHSAKPPRQASDGSATLKISMELEVAQATWKRKSSTSQAKHSNSSMWGHVWPRTGPEENDPQLSWNFSLPNSSSKFRWGLWGYIFFGQKILEYGWERATHCQARRCTAKS